MARLEETREPFRIEMADATWAVLDNWDTWGVFLLLTLLNLWVVLLRTARGASAARGVRRLLRRLSGRDDLHWLDWRLLVVVGAVWYGGFAAYGLLTGQFACQANSINDPLGELSSGRAFWNGVNPFANVPYCGSTVNVPYGLPALFLDALGSLGGLAGILFVWGAVALSVLPLTWLASGDDRRYVTVFVGTSVLCIPLITSELGGATNAIVPALLLLTVYLATRNELRASFVGGVLATARFPSLFPVLARTGSSGRSRVASFLLAVAGFAAVTGATYAVWGSGFLSTVFFDQFLRRSFSLNFYGILLLHNALPTAWWVEALQAGTTLALVAVIFLRVRSSLRAVAITLVGVALVTPFLSYNILVWLLPVALAGDRARQWLWAIATVATVDYGLGFNVLAWSDGVVWPAEVMDGIVTLLLLGLFVDLWRAELRREPTDARGESPADRPAPAALAGGAVPSTPPASG